MNADLSHGPKGARCPACASPGGRVLARPTAFALVRCPACRLVYAHPQLRERVREKYLQEYDLAEHFGPLAPRKRVLYQRRLAWLPAPRPGRDVLCDVGCGDGQFLVLAREAGWRACGIEMNGPAARKARERGFTVFEGTFEELSDLPWGQCHVVTSWDSLEHTPEPLAFAERLGRLLIAGGTLGLTTLNQRSVAWFVFRTRWSMVVEDHFTYWNAPALTSLLGRCGLETDRLEVFGLGRDFVRWIGRGSGTRPGTPRVGAEAGGWDVRSGVLTLEDVLNRVFNVVGGGVGLAVRARKHP